MFRIAESLIKFEVKVQVGDGPHSTRSSHVASTKTPTENASPPSDPDVRHRVTTRIPAPSVFSTAPPAWSNGTPRDGIHNHPDER